MEKPISITPTGEIIKVPTDYWDKLKKRNIDELCKLSLAHVYPPEDLLLHFLNEDILIDMENRSIHRLNVNKREKIENPFLELIILVYLLNVSSDDPSQDIISVRDLKNAHFFQGPHELQTAPLLDLYGNNLERFKSAAESLGGKSLDMAEAAYMLLPFPKIPLYYLLWEGDDEFEPNLSILFDRSIEKHLAADAIWGLVNLVSNYLLSGG
ncbi:MAG: DUF3786 domain-containing protein [Desulfobacterales bacterium]|nr:DUF3786 domain-containing protein [Desulfobacterales bacterium]MDX2508537.1 DUF3786 domain-containing protein [Desulfobacterales bacterium]